MLTKNYFQMKIDMFPSGEKIYKINFDQPKVVARADIFLMIGDFFKSGFPVYTSDVWDKPNGWTDDPNSQRRSEILVEMRQALVCFPNEEKAEKTVVCAGDIILTKTRENINQVKLKLLDRLDKAQTNQMHQQLLNQSILMQDFQQAFDWESNDHRKSVYATILEPDYSESPAAQINYDYSSKTSIMLVSLTDFCPYFCSIDDLNGKQLKDLKKREIMSPFNVHLNVTHMIELVRHGSRPVKLQEASQLLVFRKFKKTEISLDWTLLKLSFQDLQIFKQIFEHNAGLIRQRSEKMAFAQEESSLIEVEDCGHSSDSGNSQDTYEEYGEMPLHKGQRPQIYQAPMIGPSPYHHQITVQEPSCHEDLSQYELEDLDSEEEKIAAQDGFSIDEIRQTLKKSLEEQNFKRKTMKNHPTSPNQILMATPILSKKNQLNEESKTGSYENLNKDVYSRENISGVSLQKRNVTTGSSNSRKVGYQKTRTMQDFQTLDNARDLIQNLVKGKTQTNSNSSTGSGNVSENLQDDFEKQRAQMSAFYFVKRSSLRAEEAKMFRQNRYRKTVNQQNKNEADLSHSDEDEANIAVDDVDPISIEHTLLSRQEMKTKAFVELTSQNQAKITEEDSEDNTHGSDSEDTEPGDDVYNDLRAISIAELQQYSDSKVLQIVEEELGHDNMQVVSYGLQFIVINDYMGNYLPVFGVSVSQIFYSFGMTANKMEGSTNLRSSASYFNAIEGCWEPIVEMFDVKMTYARGKDNCTDLNLNVQEELDLNVTECLLQTLRDTYQSIKTQKYEATKTHEILKNQMPRPLTVSSSMMDFELLERVEEESKEDEENWEGRNFDKSRRGIALESDQDHIVSPYAIRNLTETEIIIQKQLTEEELCRKENHERRRRDRNFQKSTGLAETGQLQQISEEVTEQSIDSDTESQITSLTGSSKHMSQRSDNQISNFLNDTKFRDRGQRDRIFALSQSYNTGKVVQLQQHFKTVLKVGACETKDHAVNYDAQLQKQIASFKDINSNERLEEVIQVSFGRKTKAPIKEINLNKSMRPCRHYFLNQKFNEFLVYSIEFENMKRVLTLRTQYLMVNNTLHDYEIKIISLFNKDQLEMKMLKAGQSLPVPECYNQSVMQLKLARNTQESDWSEEWQIYALKKIVELDQPGYLKHGSTYTFFRKQQAKMLDTFDIILMPPLVLLNCLPVEVNISFEDSNKRRQLISLLKEETRNIFDFDLQNKIQLILQIEGYSRTSLVLDTKKEFIDEEERITLLMKDEAGRKLHINVQISQKTAGFKVCFYNANCLINNTGQNLLFFYKEPSRDEMIFEADRDIMVSQPIENISSMVLSASGREEKKVESVVHMLSNTREVFAKVDGSKVVSEPIITFTHGAKSKFSLIQRNKQLEFGYFTNMYRCSAEEPLYTKITTVQPRYIVVNYTQSTLIFAQECMKGNPLIVKSGQKAPFHWNNKNGEKLMSVQTIPSESQFAQSVYDWSIGFSVEETGSLTLHNRQKKEEHFIAQSARRERPQTQRKNTGGYFANLWQNYQKEDLKEQDLRLEPICKTQKRLFRINRKLHEQQILIIVEEEEEELPEMRIENKCQNVSIVFQQVDNTKEEEIDVCYPKESQAFAWSNPRGSKTLQIQFFRGRYLFPTEQQLIDGVNSKLGRRNIGNTLLKVVTHPKNKAATVSEHIKVTFNGLNRKKKLVQFHQADGRGLRPVYLSIITNGYTRILRFDHKPPINPITEQENQLEEEKKSVAQKMQYVAKYRTFIKMVNISICSPGKELITLYLKGISALIEKKERETLVKFELMSIQIDNQSEMDPVYHVMLKPTDMRAVIAQQGQINAAQEEEFIIPEDVFKLELTMRSDFPNVLYFKEVAFLMQRLDVKLELAHVVLLYEFGNNVSKIFNRNIVTQHEIFKNLVILPFENSTPRALLDEVVPHRAQTLVVEPNAFDDDMAEQARLDLMQHMDLLESRQTEANNQAPSRLASQSRPSNQPTYLAQYLERVKRKNSIVSNIRETKLIRRQTKAGSFLNTPCESIKQNPKVRNNSNRVPLIKIGQIQDMNLNNTFDTCDDRSDDEELVVQQVKQESSIKRVYIESYSSSPFLIRISIMKQGEIENDKANDEIAFVKKIANIGLSIMSLEQMPVNINGFEISNVYGDLTDVVEQFKGYYKQQLKQNSFSLFGGSNLLGNPVNFIDTLGTGFNDFYYEPANGFKRSYREGSMGLVKGTGSLIRNTVGGTIGSIGKVSSSIGSALLYLTGDQQFREDRSRYMIRNQPKSVMQGLESGMSTAFDSTISGLRGVVTKPTEGYRQDGAKGFAMGAIQGVAGLLVKPVSGAMDLVSKTSQGIAAASKKEKQSDDIRLRPPRVFYGKEKVIRNYDIVHANLLLIIPKLSYCLPELPEQPLKLDMNFFIDAWILEEGTHMYDWSVLVTTSDQLIKINKYTSVQAKRQDIEENERLRGIFVGESLIQISSVNSYSHMQSIELHENRMFDIVFEDNRELLTVNDQKTAETIYRTLKSLYSEIEKVRRESQNKSALVYKRPTTISVSRSHQGKLFTTKK